MERRDFLSRGLWAGVGAGFGLSFSGLDRKSPFLHSFVADGQKQDHSLDFRTLGRSGLRVTTVGYGAMRTRDPSVIHRALDLGLNYIDTARTYMDGYNEVVVGKVLKTRRKETFVATKVPYDNQLSAPGPILESVDRSLKALQTDYIDIIQIHDLKSVDEIQNEVYLSVLERVKQTGKARFVGFSTHRNEEALLDEAIRMGFYDVVLVKYNFQSSEKLGQLIRSAAEAGIGIVAMKTQAGGYVDHKMGPFSPHQAALRWVLQNEGVATAIPSMTTYGHLEENCRVMGTKLGWSDRKVLHRYGRLVDKRLCRMCDACRGTCIQGVDVPEVNRALMYAEGYRDPDLAGRTFRRINADQRSYACKLCSSCTVRCIYGLDIRTRMIRAERILG